MSKRYEWYMGTQEIIDNETREFVDAIEVIDSLEQELKEQKEKYDHLYSCYKKTSSEDLQDKYRLAEENEQNLKNMFNAYSKILEEKDKKIKQLEDELTGRKKLCDLRYNQLKQAHQEKIEFAVEQLEKVKEKIQEDRESLINYNNASEILMVDAFLCDCKNFIDNQIKQLKEMK